MDLKQKISKYWFVFFLIGIFILAFYVRAIPARYNELQALDPFYLYRMSEHVVTHNFQLPELDLLRNHPYGYNPSTELLMPYYFPAIIYTLGAGWGLDYFHYALLFPAIMGALAVLIMFFLGKELFNYKTGLLAAFFLAVVPAFITRTSAGFFEKEGIAGLFILLFIWMFIRSYKKSDWKYGILSGLSLFLLAQTWGGFTYFVALLSLFVTILLIVNQYSASLLKSFLPTFLIPTILAQFFIFNQLKLGSTMFFIFSAPFILLLIRWSTEKFNFVSKENTKYIVPGLMVLGIIGILIGSMFFDPLSSMLNKVVSFVSITPGVTLSTVAESQKGSFNIIAALTSTQYSSAIFPEMGLLLPYFSIWIFTILGIFLLIYKFIFSLIHKLYKTFDWLLLFPILWAATAILGVLGFIRLTFIVGPPFALISGFFFFWLLNKAYNLNILKKLENREIIFEVFSVIFFILASISVFFNIYLVTTSFTIALIFSILWYIIRKSVTESIFHKIYEKITGKRELGEKISVMLIPIVILLVLAIAINTANGYTYSMGLGPSICFPNPKILIDGQKCLEIDENGNYVFVKGQPWYEAMTFLREKTPEGSGILSWWDFGYWFETRGKRPAPVDGGGSENTSRKDVADWFVSNNWTEYKPWLKKLKVDYILMDYTLPGKYGAISKIASNGEKIDSILQFQQTETYPRENKTIHEFKNGPYTIWLAIQKDGNINEAPMFLISQGNQYVQKVYINDLCTKNGIIHLPKKDPPMEGCVAITSIGIFYIPEEVKNTIFTNLMFMEGAGLGIEKVFDNQLIKIYKVNI